VWIWILSSVSDIWCVATTGVSIENLFGRIDISAH
jgi:hypothetical protein